MIDATPAIVQFAIAGLRHDETLIVSDASGAPWTLQARASHPNGTWVEHWYSATFADPIIITIKKAPRSE